ncbi:hypothetical protein KCP75_22890 [Salmonella enterica subsp. enterica]|nr:hypothetical protein KCP75_22890 [Salmonella enterica subsp. enterica]
MLIRLQVLEVVVGQVAPVLFHFLIIARSNAARASVSIPAWRCGLKVLSVVPVHFLADVEFINAISFFSSIFSSDRLFHFLKLYFFFDNTLSIA